jgi:sugar/nucleoside kinase (ribokinase family)
MAIRGDGVNVQVVVAGELYTDLILSGFDFWPQPGQEAFAREFRREIGGGAAITACGLATLGTSTGFYGIAGRDAHDWVAGKLEEKRVDASMLAVDDSEPTAFTVAVTAPHDRAFFTYLGANKGFAAALIRAANAGVFGGARHVHLAWAPPWDIAASLFDAIHRCGCTVSVDAGWHEDWLADPRALPTLRSLDLFFPNETEAARMTGESAPEAMLRRFARAGVPCVALKLGAVGSALLRDDRFFRAPPLRVTPVDTTGAGDCFDAGFLHAWLRGESPEQILRIANICGALSTEQYGGIAGFPSRERLLRELENYT